ncbi:MAG: NAD(P)/FAD-dependent oxidoreductase [Candidatus Bathyarchaeia archaeon]
MRHDAIVVGAGSAGCVAARTLAERNFGVLLIDGKASANIGNKLCGNALGSHHLHVAGLKLPDEVVSNPRIEGFYIYSPDGHRMDVPGGEFGGVMLHRFRFGQYLLSLANEAGAKLRERTPVAGPLLEDGRVKGVTVGSGEKIHADIVIDASGLKSPLRMNLNAESAVEREAQGSDVVVAYRENRRLKKKFHKPEYCEIYLDQAKYPWGYAWIFPQDEYVVNVGVGVGKITRDGAPLYPHPKQRLYETILKSEAFEDSELIGSGTMGPGIGGMDIPVRKSLDSLVHDGLLFAGEAGFIINPPTAGGNGPALVSGRIAGETVASALEDEDTSRDSLWRYNVKYFSEIGYGAKYHALDAFRILLQSLSNYDLNFAVNNAIITGEDLVQTTAGGNLKIGPIDKAMRALRGLKNPTLLNKVRYISSIMKEIKADCRNYPTPEEFSTWRQRMRDRFVEIRKKCPPQAPVTAPTGA